MYDLYKSIYSQIRIIKIMSKEKKPITVRISSDLEEQLKFIAEKILNDKKGSVIRNFLSLAEILAIHNDGTIRGYNNRSLMVLKQETIQNILSKLDEKSQMDLGDDMALYVNDICRIKGDFSLEYKLKLCNRLGWFLLIFDSNRNIQIPHEFGPENFVKSFCYRLVNEKKMPMRFLSENISSDKIKKEYERVFGKGENAPSDYYTFTFMHLREE